MGQQRQNNYFISMLARYNGDQNFISYLKPEQIQKSAKERIFREMAKGSIEYTSYGNYFLDNKFLSNLIVACEDELTTIQVINASVHFYDINFPGNMNVIRVYNKYCTLEYIYSIILQRLYEVKNTGDIGPLTDIQYVLKDHAKII